jgi:ureidoglycolate lyase
VPAIAETAVSQTRRPRRARQFDQTPAFAHTTAQAWPSAAIYRNRPRDVPVDIQELERHPFSCQLFVPMGTSRWLVMVAPDDAAGRPDVVRAQVFLATGRQGICYRPGVWHSPLLTLDAESDFFTLMWSRNPSDDTEVHLPDPPVQIRF